MKKAIGRGAGVLASAVFIILASTKAQALSWNFSYSGTGVTAQGILTTDGTDYNQNQYLVTAISGTRNGVTITGLLPSGTYASNDNLLFPSSPNVVTGGGISYDLGSGNFVNLSSPESGVLFEVAQSSGAQQITNASLSPTPVPWNISPDSMLVLGLPLFIALRMLKKKIASKSSQAKQSRAIS